MERKIKRMSERTKNRARMNDFINEKRKKALTLGKRIKIMHLKLKGKT